jgi:hypothetical protein
MRTERWLDSVNLLLGLYLLFVPLFTLNSANGSTTWVRGDGRDRGSGGHSTEAGIGVHCVAAASGGAGGDEFAAARPAAGS